MVKRTINHCIAMTEGGGEDQISNIKVVVRVRPPNHHEVDNGSAIVVQPVDENMLVFDPVEKASPKVFHKRRESRGRDILKRVCKDMRYAFDRVFDGNTGTEEVFEHTTKDIINGVLNGFNCSVFAYGATGAGKTHTMLGNDSDPGIIFKTMMGLYEQIENIKDEKKCSVAVSYLEVYNEQIRDLLMPGAFLPVREDPEEGPVVTGLSLHKPANAKELLHLLAFGNKNRTQHPTDANSESSRSHAVFQVFVKQQDRTGNISAPVRIAKMSLIDLAGSERATVTTNSGERFREGANINRSLLALGNCINALAKGKKPSYVPYRDSKLTRLLKDSLGGNCRTVMIAAISPAASSYEDTYNTLNYANRAKNIKATVKSNVVNVDFHISQYTKIIAELRQEISELKQRLESNEHNKTSATGSNSAPPCTTTPINTTRTHSVSTAVTPHLTTTVNPHTPLIAAPQYDHSKMLNALYGVHQERISIRREMLELEGKQKDLVLQMQFKQRQIERVNTLLDGDLKQRTCNTLNHSITRSNHRCRNIEKNKSAVLDRFNINTTWKNNVQAECLRAGDGEVPEVLDYCKQMHEFDVELKDSRRQAKCLKRICRAQDREITSNQKLILTLLHMVKVQHFILRTNSLATLDLVNDYNMLKQRISGEISGSREVVWADQSMPSLIGDATGESSSVTGNQERENTPGRHVSSSSVSSTASFADSVMSSLSTSTAQRSEFGQILDFSSVSNQPIITKTPRGRRSYTGTTPGAKRATPRISKADVGMSAKQKILSTTYNIPSADDAPQLCISSINAAAVSTNSSTSVPTHTNRANTRSAHHGSDILSSTGIDLSSHELSATPGASLPGYSRVLKKHPAASTSGAGHTSNSDMHIHHTQQNLSECVNNVEKPPSVSKYSRVATTKSHADVNDNTMRTHINENQTHAHSSKRKALGAMSSNSSVQLDVSSRKRNLNETFVLDSVAPMPCTPLKIGSDNSGRCDTIDDGVSTTCGLTHKPRINTATVTKCAKTNENSNQSTTTASTTAQPYHPHAKRAMNFDQCSPLVSKSKTFADAVKSPAVPSVPRSPLIELNNLPASQASPPSNVHRKPQRVLATFKAKQANNTIVKQDMPAPYIPQQGSDGAVGPNKGGLSSFRVGQTPQRTATFAGRKIGNPPDTQQCSVARPRRSKSTSNVLERMGLPSVLSLIPTPARSQPHSTSNLRQGQHKPTPSQSHHKSIPAVAGPTPSYMRGTKASFRRRYNHRRSVSSGNLAAPQCGTEFKAPSIPVIQRSISTTTVMQKKSQHR